MKLTKEILELAKTDNGGYTKDQMAVLGVVFVEGESWIDKAKLKSYKKQQILDFISLRAGSKAKPKKRAKSLNDWQYNHPEWIKLRKKVLNRDNNMCRKCRCSDCQLHVHHKRYYGEFIWDVRMKHLITLCNKCHKEAHKRKKP